MLHPAAARGGKETQDNGIKTGSAHHMFNLEKGGFMKGLERLERGRVWILETLFRVAEENDCMISDLLFTPTSNGQQLFLKLNGEVVSGMFLLSEIERCAEAWALEEQMLSNRAKITQRLRDLLKAPNGARYPAMAEEGFPIGTPPV
jgi:hypothetical protein